MFSPPILGEPLLPISLVEGVLNITTSSINNNLLNAFHVPSTVVDATYILSQLGAITSLKIDTFTISIL
jgi:hypothetical protein